MVVVMLRRSPGLVSRSASALQRGRLCFPRGAQPVLVRFASAAASATESSGSANEAARAANTASSSVADATVAAAGQSLPPGTADSTAELALRTVPVPVLVGPAQAAADATVSVVAPDAAGQVALAEAAAIAGPALKPATAGGFFFHYPMTAIEFGLQSMHDGLNLPWYAAIPLFTLCARMCILPLTVFSSKMVAKMQAIKPQMDELTAAMKEANLRGTDAGLKEGEKHRQALQKLLAKHGVKPWATMLGGLGQLPLWMSFFFTLRHMMREGAGLGLETGGLLWFEDLTVRDPYYALPILTSASMYGMVTLGNPGEVANGPKDDRQAMMRNAMKGVAVLMLPMTYWMESGIFLYWISTNAIGACQTVALRQPPVRDLLGMPALPIPGASAGVLGMTPAEAAAQASKARSLNTDISLAGSQAFQPTSQAPVAAATAPKSKGKRKKKRR